MDADEYCRARGGSLASMLLDSDHGGWRFHLLNDKVPIPNIPSFLTPEVPIRIPYYTGRYSTGGTLMILGKFLNTRSPERGALGAESVLYPEKKSNSQKRLKHA